MTGDRLTLAAVVLAASLGMVSFLGGTTGQAAENIQVEVGPASRTFAVKELANFGRTGTVSRQLQYYFDQLEPEAIEGISAALNYPVQVKFVPFAKFLRSPGGECLLEKVAEFVQPDIAALSGSKSLRAAFVNASSPDGKFDAIEVLEKYPTSTIQIDQNALQGEGDRLAALEDDINALLQKAGIAEDKPLTDIDYDALAEGALDLCEKL